MTSHFLIVTTTKNSNLPFPRAGYTHRTMLSRKVSKLPWFTGPLVPQEGVHGAVRSDEILTGQLSKQLGPKNVFMS